MITSTQQMDVKYDNVHLYNMIQMIKLRLSAKKILYMLYKKSNRQLWEFSNGRGTKGKEAAIKILRRFKKKGLVDMIELPSGNKYYLTDEGDKIAKPIVDEIEEYKRW